MISLTWSSDLLLKHKYYTPDKKRKSEDQTRKIDKIYGDFLTISGFHV